MTVRVSRTPWYLLWIPFLLWVPIGSAQESADHLVISQVSLDTSHPENTWIEVYNPTSTPLILQRLGMSHVTTINVLPQTVLDQGGIKVEPAEYIILCSSERSFSNTYLASTVRSMEVDALSHLSSGGFLAVTTEGAGEAKGAVVRYGDPTRSDLVSKLAGDQVVGFSRNGKSYKRKISLTPDGVTVSNFVETAASPGKPAD
jgi:hypothetical protein